MVLLMLGYFVMGLIFLILRFFYHILPKKGSRNNLVRSVRDDFAILYTYAKQIVVSNPKKIEFIVMIMVCLIILPLTPLQLEIEFVAEDFLSFLRW